MFVMNDVRRDSRVLREAASLAAAGHRVTVVGRQPPHTAGVSREVRDGFDIVRVPYPADWARRDIFALPHRLRVRLRRMHPRGASADGPGQRAPQASRALAAEGDSRAVRDNTLGWFRSWRYGTLAWAGAAASVAPRADVWHGHDMTGLPAALAAQRRYGGRVVYDSHELYLESGRHATRPAWARRAMGVVERRWARRADAVVTVNDSIANELSRRLRVPLPTVVRNCPPRWLPRETEPPRPDLFRQTLPIPAERDILLYQGGFSAHRGLPQIVSLLHEPGLESAVVVFLGYGTLEGWLSEQAARREHHGRLFVVAAVPPDELAAWTASADVSLMPIEPSTLNHVLSTPNKLWESLAAGAPLVASDLPEMARVVRETGAGELCDPSSVESIATAVRRILSRSPEERLAMRRRARAAALDRYNWETESARLLALYETLMPQRPAPAGGPA